jgi:membrane dipeptidase
MTPIVDLHSDLLSFLAENPKHTIDDPKSRASYPQMKEGGICLQTLPIFTHSTRGSLESGMKQLSAFQNLLEKHPDKYALFSPSSLENDKISLVLAYENGYGFSEEGKPIEEGLSFLEKTLKRVEHILYISLTWDGENRFGGGVGSKVGLKEDGKRVLEWMDGKQIAIDLSHTSDFLADALLNYLDKKSLEIPVIASHSNARKVEPKERNLPDFLIQEIVTRKGMIGLNLFAPFIGKTKERLASHVEHFFNLGAEKHLSFGADFFPDLSFDYLLKKYQSDIGFFPEIGNSSCYPYLLSLLQNRLDLKETQIKNLANGNFFSYISLLKKPLAK